MNAVGIDVSKDKSMITVIQPLGVVVAAPYEVRHTESELRELAGFLKSLSGETKVIMEYTGHYYEPIARYLHDAGLFVSVVNAILIHDYYENTKVRKGKTDEKDAVKIASWGLSHWLDLPKYTPEDTVRQELKLSNRQYIQYSKIKTMMKNNLISLLDQTFPGVNTLFSSPARKEDGHEKWVDFALYFWHRECVSGISENAFKKKYEAWCHKHGYQYRESKASEIHTKARASVSDLPKDETVKFLITQAIIQLNTVTETLAAFRKEMERLASLLPEYDTVMQMYGCGPVLGCQLMAEIGDIRRYTSKKALVGYAGIDSPPNQSGKVDVSSRSISKRGSASLRKTLFQIMAVILQNSPPDEPVYQFLDRKRAEGKPYKVYMIAAANKFLRIYYARVKACIESAAASD